MLQTLGFPAEGGYLRPAPREGGLHSPSFLSGCGAFPGVNGGLTRNISEHLPSTRRKVREARPPRARGAGSRCLRNKVPRNGHGPGDGRAAPFPPHAMLGAQDRVLARGWYFISLHRGMLRPAAWQHCFFGGRGSRDQKLWPVVLYFANTGPCPDCPVDVDKTGVQYGWEAAATGSPQGRRSGKLQHGRRWFWRQCPHARGPKEPMRLSTETRLMQPTGSGCARAHTLFFSARRQPLGQQLSSEPPDNGSQCTAANSSLRCDTARRRRARKIRSPRLAPAFAIGGVASRPEKARLCRGKLTVREQAARTPVHEGL